MVMNMRTNPLLAVWAGDLLSGLLEKPPSNQHVFAYDPEAVGPLAQVSLTMPVRLQSWVSRDLHPIFQMNLPEGALLDSIRRAISKIIGADDLTILRVTGGDQIGRNRFALSGDPRPGVVETKESLAELLTYPDTKELFHDLIAKYALRSGVSGVQPKVVLEAKERGTATIGRFIVKSWGEEFPQLAANEFFCMTVAKRAGLSVPQFHLSESGGLFIMKRFDIKDDGTAIGFEDMCSLQALGTAQKYNSSYERVAKSIRDFVSGEFLQPARMEFFTSLLTSVVLRNGDAHLKNFGILYDAPGEATRFAPTYDIVTTTAYLAKDVPALSISGTKKWWPRKVIEKFAATHLGLSPAKIKQTFEAVFDAVSDTRGELTLHILQHPEFSEVGKRMQEIWDDGVKSLSE